MGKNVKAITQSTAGPSIAYLNNLSDVRCALLAGSILALYFSRESSREGALLAQSFLEGRCLQRPGSCKATPLQIQPINPTGRSTMKRTSPDKVSFEHLGHSAP